MRVYHGYKTTPEELLVKQIFAAASTSYDRHKPMLPYFYGLVILRSQYIHDLRFLYGMQILSYSMRMNVINMFSRFIVIQIYTPTLIPNMDELLMVSNV